MKENGLDDLAKEGKHPLSLIASLFPEARDEASSEPADSSSGSPNLTSKGDKISGNTSGKLPFKGFYVILTANRVRK